MVCVLSNHPLVLELLRQTLETGDFVVKAVRVGQGPDNDFDHLSLPVADIYVVDGHDPYAAVLVGTLNKNYPKGRVIVLNEKTTDTNSFLFLELGAKGLVDTSLVRQSLGRAAKTVTKGDFWVERKLLSRSLDSILQNSRRRFTLAGPHRLSRREKEVLQALLENLSNKEIARQINISERTVKFHVSNLLTKFNVRRRSELMMLHLQH